MLAEAVGAAREIERRIAEYRDGLVAKHGVRLLSRQRTLHRLGSLAVWGGGGGGATARAAADPRPESIAGCAHVVEMARRQAEALLGDPSDGGAIDVIARSLTGARA